MATSTGFGLLAVSWIWFAVVAWRRSRVWGVAVALFPPAGLLFAVGRFRAVSGPIVLGLAGLLLAAGPPVVNRLLPVDLGPRDVLVDGERHITLTGWDRHDYRVLDGAADVVVLQMAYLDEPDGPTGFRAELGLDARLIGIDNTQVYVASDPGALVVAFRGSQSPTSLDGVEDWLLTNANNLLVVPEGRIGTDFAAAGVGARFHRGFMQALDEIWAPLVQAVQEAMDASERPLRVTGHSLGGALALLAAWRFQRAFIGVHEVVTFGAPMIGNAVARLNRVSN